MSKKTKWFSILLLTIGFAVSVNSHAAKPVGITADMMDAEVIHNGKKMKISRNQNNDNKIKNDFAITSRPCPPFCIQPVTLAPGVETIAEIELIDYLKQIAAGDNSIMVVDSRTPDWVAKGTIPGTKNIPWTRLTSAEGATTEGIMAILTGEFGATQKPGVDFLEVDEAIVNGTLPQVVDYSAVKTLVLFCNGMWCGQSPTNIKALLKFGYPAEKIKWYRGGMQDWEALGLTTVPGG